MSPAQIIHNLKIEIRGYGYYVLLYHIYIELEVLFASLFCLFLNNL